jgi:ubiquinone/menaquinone biosynthesis C-methylase UbiE
MKPARRVMSPRETRSAARPGGIASLGTSNVSGAASSSRPAKLPGYAPTLLAYHRAFERELRALIDGLPMRPGDRVLDLACGDGVYAHWLAERLGEGGRVLAVDLSPAFLELARREVPKGELSDRVEFVRADLRHLPIPDDSFDLVWCAQSLYSLPDPVDALRRMERAARPRGVVAVFENDEFHHVLLPWPVEVELALRRAELTALTRLSKKPEKFYVGRHLRRVFRAAGLADCEHRTWTIDRHAPLSPADHDYFEGYLKDLRENASPHLSGEIRDEFERLVDPGSSRYLLDSSDFIATLLNHVAWSIKRGA